MKWNAFWETASKRTCQKELVKHCSHCFVGCSNDLRPVLHLVCFSVVVGIGTDNTEEGGGEGMCLSMGGGAGREEGGGG